MEYLFDTNEYSELIIKSGKISQSQFVIKCGMPPGDILMLTACVRDIKRWYPHVKISVQTSASELWDNNPYITSLDKDDPDVFELDVKYDIINKCGEFMDRHFLHGYIHDFNSRTGYAVKLTDFRADVHFTEEEKNTPVFDDQPEKFVIINAGGKTDYEVKWWWNEAWTEVIKNCPEITFLQVGKTDEGTHVHEKIEADNCIDKLGKTSLRELLRLVYQSSGTLSVVTCLMHMAGAFDKHAAIIGGGHEPWWWEKYPGQDYFHTIGRLPCCRFGGCWKNPCENKSSNDRQKCLELIDPKEVAKAIRKWFE